MPVFVSPPGKPAVRRRMTADELIAAMRRDRGVQLVDGYRRQVGGRRVHRYGNGRPIAAAGLLIAASLIHQDGGELEWETAPVPAGDLDVLFVFPMAMGQGAGFPQPTGRFDLFLGARRLLSFTTTKDTQAWQGGTCTLGFAVLEVRARAFGQRLMLDEALCDESGFADGLGLLRVPLGLLQTGRPAHLRVVAVNRQRSRNWFRLGKPRHLFATYDLHAALRDLDRATTPVQVGGHRLLLGDLHNHSAESRLLNDDGCGWGLRRELFGYARDVAGLDIFCLSEHDWQMNGDDWRHLTGLTDDFDDPGRFVTLPGYEWTSAAYGHRNVYFRDSGAEFFGSSSPESSGAGGGRNLIDDTAPTPVDLWRHLDTCGTPSLTVPHHMSVAWFPLSLEHFHDPRYDRVAEIYSCWGDSLEHRQPVSGYAQRMPELAFIKAIRSGRRVGFIASSDSHDGNPGNSQGKPGHEQLFHHLGSGRVAVLAATADRHGVFDALAARRCYALTGGRIVLEASLHGYPMGSEVPQTAVGPRPSLRLAAGSSVPLAELAVYRNGQRVDSLALGVEDVSTEWSDERPSAATATSYFVKLTRSDGEMAWTSPIWVTRTDSARQPGS